MPANGREAGEAASHGQGRATELCPGRMAGRSGSRASGLQVVPIPDSGMTGRIAVSHDPSPADLDPVDLDTALLRAAVGDYADEAAVLLLSNFGHWLPQLQSAGLITLLQDVDGPWARIDWPELDATLCAGIVFGSSGELRVLHAAASIADGRPVDLGDLAGGLDRRALVLVLAAIAHAAGSHEHRRITRDDDGIPHLEDRLPPVIGWPPRE